ncbi:MAG: MFS transporter [Hyphomicrobiaceae bacterium]
MTLARDTIPLVRTATAVVLAGCLIAMVGFGARSVMGLYLEPMTVAKGWSRETFGLAMALQNLLWGAAVPLAGGLADKFGPSRVLALGAILYGLGLCGMAVSESGLALHLTGGVLLGTGIAFTGFSIALASIAKVVGPARRSLALGLGTAAGSMGQVVFSPITQAMISGIGWYDSLLILALSVLIIIPLALVLPHDPDGAGRKAAEQTMAAALKEAMGHGGFLLLTAGFFVCGFQIAFITVHFPAYVKDLGFSPAVGAIAMALVGLFNIAGSLLAGYVGQRFRKNYGLSVIYLVRSILVVGLLMLPKSEPLILTFAATMGFLWLSTVPLTSGLVAQIFGVRYMATLFGIVFFSHQIGSFLGVWLGGLLYDQTGSYDPIWWMSVALGIFAAIVHLPIKDQPVERLKAGAA